MGKVNPKRSGSLAELHVAAQLLRDPELEVFCAMSDDGLGSDLAVRSARTGRWYSIQVKATDEKTSPYVKVKKFRHDPDFIVAAVKLDGSGMPTKTYLIPATDWHPNVRDGCLSWNPGGGKAGPYVEARIHTKRCAKELEGYALERVAPGL